MDFSGMELDAMENSAFEAGRRAGLNEAATLLDDKAQEYNRIRDPGMANHCRACARRIRALSEQGEAAQPAAEWRTMDSAPRDGTPILAANVRHPSHAPVAVIWKEEPEDSDVGPEPHWADAATHGGDALYFNALYFSHWMPLPASPGIASQAEEGSE